MNSNKVLEEVKVLPLYTVKDISSVKQVGQALIDGGIPIVEIALRTELAYDAIEILNSNKNICIGAGTVRNIKQAKEVIEKGAKFIITPGTIPEIITYCNEKKILCIPGAVTPSEIEYASTFGLTLFKYFPANVYGGINGLKALSGPYFQYKFIPTGGINVRNYTDYLEIQNVLAIGGSFIIPDTYLNNNDFKGLTEWISGIKSKINQL